MQQNLFHSFLSSNESYTNFELWKDLNIFRKLEKMQQG
jgi:hypothetical protein